MEKLALRKSDSMYFDVLKEIGNIGTGNATTSISTMLDMKVNMQVPDAELIAVQDLNTVICSEEEEVVCIYIRVHNGIEGSMMFLLKRAAAYFLLNRLFDRKQSYDKPFDGMDISAMSNSSDTLSKNVLKTSDYSLMLKCDYFHLMAFAFSITACFLWKNFLSSPILCFRIVFHHRNDEILFFEISFLGFFLI